MRAKLVFLKKMNQFESQISSEYTESDEIWSILSSSIGNGEEITYLQMIDMEHYIKLFEPNTKQFEPQIEFNLSKEDLIDECDCFLPEFEKFEPQVELDTNNECDCFLSAFKPPQKKKTKRRRNLRQKSPPDSPIDRRKKKDTGQRLCCVSKCKRFVKNRNKESLKTPHKFKKVFLNKGRTKICNYHYFRSLYISKKLKKNQK